jgi:hypothetical protein
MVRNIRDKCKFYLLLRMQVLCILMTKFKNRTLTFTFVVFPVSGIICQPFAESTFELGIWAYLLNRHECDPRVTLIVFKY